MTDKKNKGKDRDGSGFVVSHPSRKNKDAARVGHPADYSSLFSRSNFHPPTMEEMVPRPSM
jgi:hypothetical protein